MWLFVLILAGPGLRIAGAAASAERETLLFHNSDFETGTLVNWQPDGDAFNHAQPTLGDNTTTRGARPSRHQGNYWVGTFEKYDGRGGRPGDSRGDASTGTLTSEPFQIRSPYLTFLISGGNKPQTCSVALRVGGKEVLAATGHQTETMRRVVWDVSAWQGKQAQIVVKDQDREPWGVINVDDFRASSEIPELERRALYAQRLEQATWHVRLRPLCDRCNDRSEQVIGASPGCRLLAIDGQLLFEMTTTRNDIPLTVNVPLAQVGRGLPHDLVVRFSEGRLDLFVDGVWVDNDYPLGEFRSDTTPLTVSDDSQSAVELNECWNRCLSDAEIVEKSGGTTAVAQRQQEFHFQMFSPADEPLQYWKPNSHFRVGDCLPFYYDSTYHFVYLLDRRGHRSKNGGGAHQWIQATSHDLVHWQHQPIMIPITQQWENSICTGSTYCHDGQYFAFYATRTDQGELLSYATSGDGIHFEKQLPNPFASPGQFYRQGSFRDPNVFQDPATGQFQMLVSANAADTGEGCIAHLTSSDLRNWTHQPPFYRPGSPHVPECIDTFRMGDFYYLVFSLEGRAHYRFSKSPMGPWSRVENDLLGGPGAVVLKTAQFQDDRRIGAAFVGDHGYAGYAVFREITQNPDGSLNNKLPSEMTPGGGEPLPWSLAAVGGETARQGDNVIVQTAGSGECRGVLGAMPTNFRLQMTIAPTEEAQHFGLRIGARSDGTGGVDLPFVPAAQKAAFGMEHVTGLDRPFTLEVLVHNRLLDLCIDNRRTGVILLDGQQHGNTLTLYTLSGAVEFQNIVIRATTPTLTVTPGPLDNTQQVELESPGWEGEIYYTLDTTDPKGPTARLYCGPLLVTTGTPMRARVRCEGGTWTRTLEKQL